MCELPPPQHSIPSADCRTATCAAETGRAPLETSGTCGEPVGSFRSDLSVDAVCTQRACAGLKTEGGGAGASFRAMATLGRRAFSGRLNVACVGPRVQRVVDAFGNCSLTRLWRIVRFRTATCIAPLSGCGAYLRLFSSLLVVVRLPFRLSRRVHAVFRIL